MKLSSLCLSSTLLVSLNSIHAYAQATEPSIVGNWSSIPIPDASGLGTIRYLWNFTNTGDLRMEGIIQVIAPLGRGMVKLSFLGRYSLPNLQGSAQTIHGLDISFHKKLITLYNKEQVDNANKDKNCGYSDWRIGVAQDVTGRPCEDKDLLSYGYAYPFTYTLRDGNLFLSYNPYAEDLPRDRLTPIYDDLPYEKLDN